MDSTGGGVALSIEALCWSHVSVCSGLRGMCMMSDGPTVASRHREQSTSGKHGAEGCTVVETAVEVQYLIGCRGRSAPASA